MTPCFSQGHSGLLLSVPRRRDTAYIGKCILGRQRSPSGGTLHGKHKSPCSPRLSQPAHGQCSLAQTESSPRGVPRHTSKMSSEVKLWCDPCHSYGSLLNMSTPQAGPRGAIYLWGTLIIPIAGSILLPLNRLGQVSPSEMQGNQTPTYPLWKVPMTMNTN